MSHSEDYIREIFDYQRGAYYDFLIPYPIAPNETIGWPTRYTYQVRVDYLDNEIALVARCRLDDNDPIDKWLWAERRFTILALMSMTQPSLAIHQFHQETQRYFKSVAEQRLKMETVFNYEEKKKPTFEYSKRPKSW